MRQLHDPHPHASAPIAHRARCLLACVGGAGLVGMCRCPSSSNGRLRRATPSREAGQLGELRAAMGDAAPLREGHDHQLRRTADRSSRTAKQVAARSHARAPALIDAMLNGDDDADTADPAASCGRSSRPTPKRAEPVLKQLEAGGYDNAAVANTACAARAKRRRSHAAAMQLVELATALRTKGRSLADQGRAAGTQRRGWLLRRWSLLLAVVVVVPLTLANMASIMPPARRRQARWPRRSPRAT